jgi:hypothetical protein
MRQNSNEVPTRRIKEAETSEAWRTVNVLYAFSAVLGDAVGLVIARSQSVRDLISDVIAGISTFECDFYWDRYPLTSKHLS